MDQKTADVQSVSHKAGIVAFELIDAVDWRRDGECLKAGFGATVEPGRQPMNASPVYALGDMFRFQWGSSRLADWLSKKQH
jgi:hypothetical protein